METALVFDIHRGTTHDGSGMRTTLFFKGCPLSCKWCHNPEGIALKPSLKWNKKKCIACFTCVNACENSGIKFGENSLEIDKALEEENLKIAELCPAKALTKVGKTYTLESLTKEALKDEMFFEEFNGGITLSGGEPLLQFDFILEFLKILKSKNIHTCLDTSGCANWQKFEKLYNFVDLFLYDVKIFDSNLHKHYTGLDNALIKENLKLLSNKISQNPNKELWIRTPLIPNATALEKNIEQIGNFLESQDIMKSISRWELCAFNNVCKTKYQELNLKWDYQDEALMKEDEITLLGEIAKKYAKEKLVISGLSSK